jgi:transposase
MPIIGAFDVHRKQITFKWLHTETGEIERGRIAPGIREPVREFLVPFKGLDAHFALEATTGWRFIAEELSRAGLTAHLAEPADTAALRGTKRRAKTDRRDCDHMVDLLLAGRLPESWLPPEHVLEIRTLVRLRKDLADERREWQQRIQAQLFHQGIPSISFTMTRTQEREQLAAADLSAAGRRVVTTGLEVMEHLDRQLMPLDAYLVRFAKLQPGCRALKQRLFGVGDITAVFIWAELGDCIRFSSSDDAVRYTGLDITVYASADKRPPGHLSRQGPEALRWALYEAAQCAVRRASPDYAYYQQVKERLNHKRACLSVARKICRRAHHILRTLGEGAFAPVDVSILPSFETLVTETA